MEPQFTVTPPSTEPQGAKANKKKLLVGIILAIVVIIGAVTAFVLTRPKSTTPSAHQKPAQTTLTLAASANPIRYADNPVYDACNMVPIDLFKKHIEKFDETFSSLGSERRLNNPLMIDHGYIDRTIAQPLGNDDKPRSTKVTIGETGTDSSLRASAFTDLADSHCMYAQGKNFNTSFGEVYVLQKPTPLSGDLLKYLDQLKAKGRLAKDVSGIQAYAEPVRPGDDDLTVILRKGTTVVFFSSLSQPLIEAATTAIFNALLAGPAGPMTATYPDVYGKLVDTCSLIPADTFTQLTGLPTSAVVTETLALTEVEKDTAERSCHRIEVERTNHTPISSIDVTLSQSRTEDAAKARIATMQTAPDTSFTPLGENLGSESFIRTKTAVSEKSYSVVIRQGSAILEIIYDNEQGSYASIDDFKTKITPVAKAVFDKFQQS